MLFMSAKRITHVGQERTVWRYVFVPEKQAGGLGGGVAFRFTNVALSNAEF